MTFHGPGGRDPQARNEWDRDSRTRASLECKQFDYRESRRFPHIVHIWLVSHSNQQDCSYPLAAYLGGSVRSQRDRRHDREARC